jgi:hypothetical protein
LLLRRLLLFLVVWAAQICLPAQPVDFVKEILPVLTSRCLVCHTGDAAQAGLRLHTREEMLRGGQSGPAVVPGKSGESLLVAKITGRAAKGLRMPPTGPPLDEATIALIRNWIDQGAQFQGTATGPPDRLAPLAPREPPIPPGRAENPVDRFVDAYFARERIQPGAPVSDALFARRVYLDLWGLLPAPPELEAFLGDSAKDKRARLVDRLLAGNQEYAGHWISFWNDLLRNDEGVVYHGERKSITKWLLGALERNLPYDQMVRALLNPVAPADPEGFLIGVTWRGVVSASQSPPMQAAQNSAQVFLGMNLKCAACHDSFVNRWKLRDTYGLAAMFSTEKLELVRCDVPMGQTAEARFPIPDLKVGFDASLESRRRAAAEWFTHRENGRFSRTLVNRVWRQLFGRGLIEPVDDMDAQAWDQDLLDRLASDFAAHGYDLKELLRRIMTSDAYAMAAVIEQEPPKTYVFRGPRLRRLTAEQFQDAISLVSGDWRVSVPRNDVEAIYTREWRLKSDPLSRALGRPIRDQVYTERGSEATTLQALELTNGPLLSKRLERAALSILGKLPPAPINLFDSKVVRSGAVEVDIDITGARQLWLLIEDVDSYDRARVLAGWKNAELIGPDGAAPVEGLELGPVPSRVVRDIGGKGFTRFRGQAVIDERSRASDISPAVRFFVFGEEPNPERLVRVSNEPPAPPPQTDDPVNWLYRHLLSRQPTAAEREAAKSAGPESPQGLEDLLWALVMSPEFQFIH